MEAMFIQKYPIISRFNRRLEERELDKAEAYLCTIIDHFIEQLFGDEEFTYFELYEFYLKTFVNCAEFARKMYKIKHFEINTYYFEKNFKPIETK